MSSVGLVLLTCEQTGNKGMSSDVKREITQALQEGHGADKGITFFCNFSSVLFFDFETCKTIDVSDSDVCLLA